MDDIFVIQWKLTDNNNVTNAYGYGYDINDSDNPQRTQIVRKFNPFVYIDSPNWNKLTSLLRTRDIDEVITHLDHALSTINNVVTSIKLESSASLRPVSQLEKNNFYKFEFLCLEYYDKFILYLQSHKIWCVENNVDMLTRFLVSTNSKAVGWQNDSSALPIKMRILSFDIEAYTDRYPSFPNCQIEQDCIYLISLSLTVGTINVSNRILVFTEHSPEDIVAVLKDETISLDDIRTYQNEPDLLLAFFDSINEFDPDIISGYNIFKFDIPYIMGRMKLFNLEQPNISPIEEGKTNVAYTKWQTKAKSVDNTVWEIDGRVVFDLYEFLRRDHKNLMSYSLDNVAKQFLDSGNAKLELPYYDQFEMYKRGKVEDIASLVRYCNRDANLVSELLDFFKISTSLLETSRLTNTPMQALYYGGVDTSIKNSLYGYCKNQNYIFNVYRSPIKKDSDGNIIKDATEIGVQGAHVENPHRGLHHWMFVMDFASLYPSIIIAKNICHSTYVKYPNEDQKKHLNLIKTNIGDAYFYKSEKREGIVPRMLKMFLSERSLVKKAANKAKSKDDNNNYVILDKRQLSLKIMANSMYGSFGNIYSALHLKIACAAVTATAREYIMDTIHIINNQMFVGQTPSKVVYGDTDSCFVTNAECTSEEQCKNLAGRITKACAKKFEDNISFDFEEVYERAILLKKKMYIVQLPTKKTRSGIEYTEYDRIKFKGVAAVKKKSCEFLRTLYINLAICCINEPENPSKIRKFLFDTLRVLHDSKLSLDIIKQLISRIDVKDLDTYKSSGTSCNKTFFHKLMVENRLPRAGSQIEYLYAFNRKDPWHRSKVSDFMVLYSDISKMPEQYEINKMYYLNNHILPSVALMIVGIGLEKHFDWINVKDNEKISINANKSERAFLNQNTNLLSYYSVISPKKDI